MTVSAALFAVKDIVAAIVPADGPTLSGVYVYPDEYAGMPKTPRLPFAVVERIKGITSDRWYQAHTGLYVHEWEIRIMLNIGQGEQVNPSDVLAQYMLYENNWESDVIQALAANQNLNGTAITAGAPVGDSFSLAAPDLTWEQWNVEVYYGIAFRVPVSQEAVF